MTSDSNPPGAKKGGKLVLFGRKFIRGMYASTRRPRRESIRLGCKRPLSLRRLVRRKSRGRPSRIIIPIFTTLLLLPYLLLFLFSPYLSSILTYNTPSSSVPPIQQGVGDDEVNFIHDCAAAVDLLADFSLCNAPKSVSFTVVVAVPNSSAQSNQEVKLRHGFGSALLFGETNIIWQLSKTHKMKFVDENCICATGRASAASWDFIRNPDRYGDRKYHLTIKRDVYFASAGEDHASETTSEGAEDEDCSSPMAEQIMRSLEDPHGTPESSKPGDCTLEDADDEVEPEPDP